MDESRIPLPGDILFFESWKPHGLAIAFRQRKMGLRHYQYMHAALVIDGDLIVESTTRYGVRKVRLSTVKKPRDYLNATVLRKPSDLSSFDPAAIEETLQLAKSAYYFYKEAYDWRGIADRNLEREGKSICSVFVKKALLLAERVPVTAFEGYRNQIFPAELFGVLLDAGYHVLENGYDVENWSPSALLPMDLLDVQETSRDQSAQFSGINDWNSRYRQSVDGFVEKELLGTPPLLMKYVWAFRAADNLTFLEFIHHRFDVILSDFKCIEVEINKAPASWRDRSTARDSLLLLMNTMVKHCKTTIRFVGAFLEVVPGKTTMARIGQLERPNKENVGEMIASIALLMSEVFLVTGATDLDQLDTKVEEARTKLQAYKKAAASYPAVEKLDLPLLDDVYKNPIELLEKLANLFRSEEQALGKPLMDQIVATAKAGVERTLNELDGMRAAANS